MNMKGLYTIILLIFSNTFMTIAWYGHLRFKDLPFMKNIGLFGTIFISWGIALLEYMLMVPTNKIGSKINGGPFDMWQNYSGSYFCERVHRVYFNLFQNRPIAHQSHHRFYVSNCCHIFLFQKIAVFHTNLKTKNSSH